MRVEEIVCVFCINPRCMDCCRMHLDSLLGCRIPVRHWIQTALEPIAEGIPVCAQKLDFATFARRQEKMWIQASCYLKGQLIPILQSVF